MNKIGQSIVVGCLILEAAYLESTGHKSDGLWILVVILSILMF